MRNVLVPLDTEIGVLVQIFVHEATSNPSTEYRAMANSMLS